MTEQNKPSIQLFDGTKKWYVGDKLHREDGPAIKYSNGSVEYWLNGQLHREDGPAIEYSNGYKAYYLNGQLHREDGPAVERPNGSVEYWLNGQLHREDGPAVEYSDSFVEYWVSGKRLSKEEYMRHTSQKTVVLSKSKTYKILKGELGGTNDVPVKISRCGNFAWFKKLNRNIRVHAKHLGEIPKLKLGKGRTDFYTAPNNPCGEIPKTKAETISNIHNKEDEEMQALHVIAHSYISSENRLRIERLKNSLKERAETNIAEIAAIKKGVGQTQVPKKYTWLIANLGVILCIVCLLLLVLPN